MPRVKARMISLIAPAAQALGRMRGDVGGDHVLERPLEDQRRRAGDELAKSWPASPGGVWHSRQWAIAAR